MPRFLTSTEGAPPGSRAVHAVLIGATYKRLVVSALPGLKPDGGLAEGAAAQVEQAFDSLATLLATAGLARDDLVRVAVTIAFADADGLVAATAAARLGGLRPALGVRQVAALSQPGSLIEIDAEAVREG